MKRILIAGGAGFLGSHLCDFFLNKQFEVVCVDNLATGSTRNIEHLMGNNRFAYIEHDIINPLRVEQDFDYVLNFASPASPPDYHRLPIQTMLVGSMGTYNLLEFVTQIMFVNLKGQPQTASQNKPW